MWWKTTGFREKKNRLAKTFEEPELPWDNSPCWNQVTRLVVTEREGASNQHLRTLPQGHFHSTPSEQFALLIMQNDVGTQHWISLVERCRKILWLGYEKLWVKFKVAKWKVIHAGVGGELWHCRSQSPPCNVAPAPHQKSNLCWPCSRVLGQKKYRWFVISVISFSVTNVGTDLGIGP